MGGSEYRATERREKIRREEEDTCAKARWSCPLFPFSFSPTLVLTLRSPQNADRLRAWESVGDTCVELDTFTRARFWALSA